MPLDEATNVEITDLLVFFHVFVAFVFLRYTSAFQGSGDFTDLMGRPVRLPSELCGTCPREREAEAGA